jgi:hypothetical protein
VLLVSGAEKLSSIASTDEQSPAAAPLSSLIAEGSGLGIQVIAAGLPAFGLYRPGAYIDRRIVFEAADMADYVGLGCPRALLGEIRGARRGVDVASRLAVQFCSLAANEVNESDALDGLIVRLGERYRTTFTRPPRLITEVTWPTRVSAMAEHLRSTPARITSPLLVGLNSEGGDPIWVDPAGLGGPMFVAGAPKSGRSNALRAVGLLARHAGWDVVGVAVSLTSPLLAADCPFGVVELAVLDQRIEKALSPLLILIDDVHKLGDNTGVLPTLLSRCQAIVVSAPPTWFGGMQRWLTDLGLMRSVNGIVLMPDSGSDFDLVGLKSDSLGAGGGTTGRRAGQGLLGISGDVSQITVPLCELD